MPIGGMQAVTAIRSMAFAPASPHSKSRTFNLIAPTHFWPGYATQTLSID